MHNHIAKQGRTELREMEWTTETDYSIDTVNVTTELAENAVV